MNKEWRKFSVLALVFLVAYFLPLGNPKIQNAIQESFRLLQWYARMHTLACVVPAMFIAGAIIAFLSQSSVMRYLGPNSNKWIAYSVASVSGCILAVCSCSVLPVFAGIYALGAGLGPATAFLYSGPAINILAIFLTARVLGFDIGVTRAVGAIVFAFVIGLIMAGIFYKEEKQKVKVAMQMPESEKGSRPLWKTVLYFACMVLFLVFSDWYNPGDVKITLNDGAVLNAHIRYETGNSYTFEIFDEQGRATGEVRTFEKNEVRSVEPIPSLVLSIYHIRWYLAGLMGLAVLMMVVLWFKKKEVLQWMSATWDFTKMIVPLLFGGVFVVGFISVLIPEKQVAMLVGNSGIISNLIASVVGTLFYFATLTEVPITETLMKLGMAKGPAIALLLAGPALSLPSIIVLWRIMGAKKTLVFASLTVVMATIVGFLFGVFVR
jgi:hypothetical protein